MLVLTRKRGESIVIGDDVVISVQSIGGNRVKLGINAPGKITIIRSGVNDLDRNATCRSHESQGLIERDQA